MPLIEEFVNLATILPLDIEVTKIAIQIHRNLRRLKLGDTIIAATAIVHNLILVTNNVKDFNTIQNLTVIDPHSV
jgi:predicted nucleic acid-binding protein